MNEYTITHTIHLFIHCSHSLSISFVPWRLPRSWVPRVTLETCEASKAIEDEGLASFLLGHTWEIGSPGSMELPEDSGCLEARWIWGPNVYPRASYVNGGAHCKMKMQD